MKPASPPRQQCIATARVALPLVTFVRIVVERGHHRGPGPASAPSSRHACAPPAARRPRRDHPRRSRGSRPATTSSTTSAPRAGRCGRRRRPKGAAPKRVGIPAKAQVALVGGDDRAAFARPADDLAEVLGAEHGTGRVARRVEEDQRGAGDRAGSASRVQHLRAGELGHRRRRSGRRIRAPRRRRRTEPEERRQPGDEFLGADCGQDGVLGHVGDAVAAASTPRRRMREARECLRWSGSPVPSWRRRARRG